MEGPGDRDPGAMDRDVDPARHCHALLHQGHEGLGIAHVAGRREDGSSVPCEALRHEVEARRIHVGQQQVPALAREDLGAGEPEAARGARDEGAAARKTL